MNMDYGTESSGKDLLYEVVWPRGKKTEQASSFAQRLDTLEGKTVCELWDGLFRGDEIFSLLERGLTKIFRGVKFVNWADFPKDGTHGLPNWKAHPSILVDKECDAVIIATGA